MGRVSLASVVDDDEVVVDVIFVDGLARLDSSLFLVARASLNRDITSKDLLSIVDGWVLAENN